MVSTILTIFMNLSQEPTSCTLTVRVVPTFSVPAAEGLAFKPTPETRVHGAQLRADYAKVQVDSVKPEFDHFPLPLAPNDEVLTLGNARGTFIQWPKDLIEIRVIPRPSTAPSGRLIVQTTPAPSAPPAPGRHEIDDVQLQYDTDFGGEPMEVDSMAITKPPPMKKSRKAHSSPQRRVIEKPAAGVRGKGKLHLSRLAPTKLDLTKGPVTHRKPVPPSSYQLGMPLVGDDVLATMGTACKELHMYYMEKSNVRRKNRENDIIGEHARAPFLGPSNFIVIDFKDLFDLYRLRSVDTTLLKCYSL